jgi:hypothetical protein
MSAMRGGACASGAAVARARARTRSSAAVAAAAAPLPPLAAPPAARLSVSGRGCALPSHAAHAAARRRRAPGAPRAAAASSAPAPPPPPPPPRAPSAPSLVAATDAAADALSDDEVAYFSRFAEARAPPPHHTRTRAAHTRAVLA